MAALWWGNGKSDPTTSMIPVLLPEYYQGIDPCGWPRPVTEPAALEVPGRTAKI